MAATRKEMADASSAADSPRYKPKTTIVAAFMFHYPCLLSSRTFKNVEECRTLSKFVELCRKAAQTIDAMEKSDEDTKVKHPWITETMGRLAQRRGKKPDTKAGQLRALWPEIRAAKAEGQSLATICQWLEEDASIVVTVQSLGSYITRMRRKEPVTPVAPTPPPAPVRLKTPVSTTRSKISVTTKKTRGFEYPPGPPDESKLI